MYFYSIPFYFPSPDIPFETENDLRIKGTARTPDVLLSTPVGMKVPKRSSTSRKLLLDESDGHLAQRKDTSSEDGEEEYEWKVVCWIDSKVRWGRSYQHDDMTAPNIVVF